jgi:hypothetical protein
MAGDETPLEYAEVTDEVYAAQITRFEPQAAHGGTYLRGPCPRCGDSMEFPVVESVFRSIRPPSASAQPTVDSPVVPMMCTCLVAHPGAPQGLPGCGAYWNIRIETGP